MHQPVGLSCLPIGQFVSSVQFSFVSVSDAYIELPGLVIFLQCWLSQLCVFLQWFGYYKPGQTSQKNTLQESALYKEVTPLSLFICFLCILWKTFFMFAFV